MPNIKNYLKDKENREATHEVYESKIFRHRLGGVLRIVILLAILVALILYIVIQWRSHIYTYYDTVSTLERQVVSGTEDIRLGNNVLTYSRDGAHCTDVRGNVLWNQTFEIREPMVSTCQDVAVIADYNGRDVYVVSDSEILGSFSTNMPIRSIAVAAAGRVAVVMDDSSVTHYSIYSADGTQLYNGQATMSSSGYPISLSLSPNGELMQISYIYLDAGEMKSNVAFYNLGDVGANRNDFFVGAYSYGDLVPYVRFMTNEVSFAVGDGSLMLYKGSQIPEEMGRFLYAEEVQSVFYSDQYVGLVFYGDSGNSLYKMNVYDTSGRQVGTYPFNIQYSDILFGDDFFVVYNSEECEIMTLKSVEKFHGTFEKTVRRMVPQGFSQRYLLVTNDSLDVIQLR